MKTPVNARWSRRGPSSSPSVVADSTVRNKATPALTLEVAGDVILDLVVARRAEKQGPVHQRELLKDRQGSVAQRAVDHVPLAGTERRQDKPARGASTLRLAHAAAVDHRCLHVTVAQANYG